jgi:two-component SAPR family response regulator
MWRRIARLFKKQPRINIALCDEDPAVTAQLETLLNSRRHPLRGPLQIHCFHQSAALCAALTPKAADPWLIPFDVIFLALDTVDLAAVERIRAEYETPLLVFMSADDSCCKDLFDFQPCAFLGKPLAEADVTEVLRRISKRYRN